MTEQQTEALDLLGREIGIGDHVVWGVASGIRHGFVKEIIPSGKRFRVKASVAPGGSGRGTTCWSTNFCGIVLPDIQDPEIQLAEEPKAPSDTALLGYP